MTDQNMTDNIDFTDEEMSVLNNIQKKMFGDLGESMSPEKLHQILSEDFEKDPNFLEDPIHKRKMTNFAREIRFKLFGEVSSLNEKGQLSNVEPLIDCYLYIPVPANVNIQEQIDCLRNNIEQSLQSLAQNLHIKTNFDDTKNASAT